MDKALLEGKRILIVEDDVTNMAVYAVALRKFGATAMIDPLNTDTMRMIQLSLPLDIILLDLMLRHSKDGYDIFDQLQADPALAGIPVLAISAADPTIEIPKAKEKGFVGFIGKPIDPTKFVEQIASCINGEQVWYAYDSRGFGL